MYHYSLFSLLTTLGIYSIHILQVSADRNQRNVVNILVFLFSWVRFCICSHWGICKQIPVMGIETMMGGEIILRRIVLLLQGNCLGKVVTLTSSKRRLVFLVKQGGISSAWPETLIYLRFFLNHPKVLSLRVSSIFPSMPFLSNNKLSKGLSSSYVVRQHPA